MEAKFGGKYYAGKTSMEWDLNDWKWDGDLLSAMPSDCRSRPLFPGVEAANTNGKRRVDEEEQVNLNLGGQAYPIITEEDKNGKKAKVGAVCQVDDCGSDLTGAKDYHRRHKVCNLHSKATKALVGNVMQRFCQQCSRFHGLQEFDEGKRSCRRRLAGHNRRRRKTHPENTLNDKRSTSYLLVSLLRILSNIQSNTSDQDLLAHLLRNLATTANQTNLLQDAAGTSFAKDPVRQTSEPENMHAGAPCQTTAPTEATAGKMKLNNIDLNMVYDDSQDCMEPTENIENVHHHKSSPPQTSGNSASTATQSPSSSSGEAQSRTDRIVFKLFGKDPNDLPPVLRNQILNWLLHSPTDIEGYIRPGCIILAVYLRMESSSWDKLCCDLSSYLRKLLDASSDPFWRTGWVYARVLDHVAFVCDGQIVLNNHIPDKSSSILNITPVAVSASERAHFSVKGLNISWTTSRMLCALEGNYLFQTSCSDIIMEGTDLSDIQSLSFSCSIPSNISGRGFIEIEDDSLSSTYFPFIVAEKDVCSEIRMLESNIENKALEFINEMGWLLHRSQLKLRLASMDPNSHLFSFKRFRWLIEFSVDHDWCAVVKKLLGIIFSGAVDTADHASVEFALVEVGLLHRAVSRNSKPMVDFLLSYQPGLFRPDAAGPAGLTPLHVAAGKDCSERILDALTDEVGLEAWSKCRDASGLSPYDYASMRGHYRYIHLVERKMTKKRLYLVLDIQSEKAVVASCSQCQRKMAANGAGRSSLAIYKPAMLSMVAIAAVCVCVALLFKSSPQVMYVFQPFIWERLKYGAS